MTQLTVLPPQFIEGTSNKEPYIKAFLKWAGGKSRILDRIKAVLPQGNRFIEPFIGSGVVFLNMDYPAYLLADSNQDLINLFLHLQNEGQDFIDYCKEYFVADNNSETAYYSFRDLFNTTIDTRLKAALFVYLNRHCFNGLCRYNSKGGFNVPFGRYKSPPFPEAAMLKFHMKSHNATFTTADFRETMDKAKSGDVVYCDPPYVPLSATSSFAEYATEGFGMAEQQALADMAKKLMKRGVTVVISNHETEFTLEAYKPARILTFDVQRFISCDGDNRKKVGELLAVFA